MKLPNIKQILLVIAIVICKEKSKENLDINVRV